MAGNWSCWRRPPGRFRVPFSTGIEAGHLQHRRRSLVWPGEPAGAPRRPPLPPGAQLLPPASPSGPRRPANSTVDIAPLRARGWTRQLSVVLYALFRSRRSPRRGTRFRFHRRAQPQRQSIVAFLAFRLCVCPCVTNPTVSLAAEPSLPSPPLLCVAVLERYRRAGTVDPRRSVSPDPTEDSVFSFVRVASIPQHPFKIRTPQIQSQTQA